MSEFDFATGFDSVSNRLKGERVERLERRNRILSFGMKYLDAALGGIFPNDLILLGAKTGIGKTELASMVAGHNALRGKRVHYFALEAEPNEIERRLKYKLIARYCEQNAMEIRLRMNFLDWYMGEFDSELGQIEEKADLVIAEKFKTLSTFYRFQDFTAEDLAKRLLAIQDQTDLIIVDHLHFIDSDEDNENRAYKLITKKIRDVAGLMAKPVLLVAHIRKSDRKARRIVPDIEDFHGTSDIPKIATKAVMIAPGDSNSDRPWLWDTYVHATKCRLEGARTRFLASITFNARKNVYEPEFTLCRFTKGGEEAEPVPPDKIPMWARGRIREPGSDDE